MNTWESRKETLDAIYKRLISNCDKLNAEDAVFYTTPLCDIMLKALGELENFHRENEVNELLNSIVGVQGSDTTGDDSSNAA